MAFANRLTFLTAGLLLLVSALPVRAQCIDYGSDDPLTLDPPRVMTTDGSIESLGLREGTPWVVRSIYGGLAIVDMSDPQNPTLEEPQTISDEAFAVAFDGDLACVAYLDWSVGCGIKVIDVNVVGQPVVLGELPLQSHGCVYGVDMAAGFAYATLYNTGLGIVDLSDPASPQLVGTAATSGTPIEVTVAGGFAYLSDGDLQIIDVSDPTAPSLVGTLATTGNVNHTRISGNRAYVCDSDGLAIVDVSDPTLPQLIGRVSTPGQARWSVVEGSLAYVADGYEGMQVVDITDESSPVILGGVNFTPPGGGALTQVELWQGQVLIVENSMTILPPQCTVVTAPPPSTPATITSLRSWPNPFNPRTSIQFDLEREARVSLEIFDTRGKRVRTLLHSALRSAGPHSVDWNGVDDAGHSVASGVYRCRMVTGNESRAWTLALVR